jgi:hypothetical protein
MLEVVEGNAETGEMPQYEVRLVPSLQNPFLDFRQMGKAGQPA